jgi:hypothetical protein
MGSIPVRCLSPIPRLFNPLSPDLFPPYDYYEPSTNADPPGQV